MQPVPILSNIPIPMIHLWNAVDDYYWIFARVEKKTIDSFPRTVAHILIMKNGTGYDVPDYAQVAIDREEFQKTSPFNAVFNDDATNAIVLMSDYAGTSYAATYEGIESIIITVKDAASYPKWTPGLSFTCYKVYMSTEVDPITEMDMSSSAPTNTYGFGSPVFYSGGDGDDIHTPDTYWCTETDMKRAHLSPNNPLITNSVSQCAIGKGIIARVFSGHFANIRVYNKHIGIPDAVRYSVRSQDSTLLNPVLYVLGSDEVSDQSVPQVDYNNSVDIFSDVLYFGSDPVVLNSGISTLNMTDTLVVVSSNVYTDVTGGYVNIYHLNELLQGVGTRVFLNQTLSDPVLLGYIEGPPPIAGENLTQFLGSTGYYPTEHVFSECRVSKSETVELSISNSGYKSSGTTDEVHIKVGPEFEFKVAPGVSDAIPFPVPIPQFGFHIKPGYKGSSSTGFSRSTTDGITPKSYTDSTVSTTEYTCQASGHHELVDMWKPETDRPHIPGRYVLRNNGTIYLQATVENKFRIEYKGVTFKIQQEPTGSEPIKLSQSFPMNPKYRCVGSLDGTLGYQFSLDGKSYKPFIPVSLRQTLNLMSYNSGTKASYMDLYRGARFDMLIDNEKKRVSDLRVVSTDPEKPEFIPAYTGYYPPIKQSHSVNFETTQSSNGPVSRTITHGTPLRNDHHTHDTGDSFTLDVGAWFQPLQWNPKIVGQLDYSHTGNKASEKTYMKSTTTTNEIHLENTISTVFIDGPDVMYISMKNTEQFVESTGIRITEHLTYDEFPLDELPPYDRGIVEMYKKKNKQCIFVLAAVGHFILCEITNIGNIKTLPRPGTVRTYQYDSYLLTNDRTSFNEFFTTVADPKWLQIPGGIAQKILDNRNATTPTGVSRQPIMVDRVSHIVNYVDRNESLVGQTIAEDVPPALETIASVLWDVTSDGNTKEYVPWEYFKVRSPVYNIGNVLDIISRHKNHIIGVIAKRDDTTGDIMYLAPILTPEPIIRIENILTITEPRDELIFLEFRDDGLALDPYTNKIKDPRNIILGDPDGNYMRTNQRLIPIDNLQRFTGNDKYIMTPDIDKTMFYYYHEIQRRLRDNYVFVSDSLRNDGDWKIPLGTTMITDIYYELEQDLVEVYITKQALVNLRISKRGTTSNGKKMMKLPLDGWWGISTKEHPQSFRDFDVSYGWLLPSKLDLKKMDIGRLTGMDEIMLENVTNNCLTTNPLWLFAYSNIDQSPPFIKQSFTCRIHNSILDSYDPLYPYKNNSLVENKIGRRNTTQYFNDNNIDISTVDPAYIDIGNDGFYYTHHETLSLTNRFIVNYT